jgi:hypothetical protein
VPDGKVGHDAFAVIRETIRSLDKVALARVVLTNREHVIALEAREKGLMGMLLRYPYAVRDASEYFDDIQDVKITKDMLLRGASSSRSPGISNQKGLRITTRSRWPNCSRRSRKASSPRRRRQRPATWSTYGRAARQSEGVPGKRRSRRRIRSASARIRPLLLFSTTALLRARQAFGSYPFLASPG